MMPEEIDQANLLAIDLLEILGYQSPSEEEIQLVALVITKLEQFQAPPNE